MLKKMSCIEALRPAVTLKRSTAGLSSIFCSNFILPETCTLCLFFICEIYCILSYSADIDTI